MKENRIQIEHYDIEYKNKETRNIKAKTKMETSAHINTHSQTIAEHFKIELYVFQVSKFCSTTRNNRFFKLGAYFKQ